LSKSENIFYLLAVSRFALICEADDFEGVLKGERLEKIFLTLKLVNKKILAFA